MVAVYAFVILAFAFLSAPGAASMQIESSTSRDRSLATTYTFDSSSNHSSTRSTSPDAETRWASDQPAPTPTGRVLLDTTRGVSGDAHAAISSNVGHKTSSHHAARRHRARHENRLRYASSPNSRQYQRALTASRGGNSQQQRTAKLSLTARDLLAADKHVVDFEHNTIVDIPAADRDSADVAQRETIDSYVRKNCTACLLREEAKISRIQQIKRDIMAKLGLQRPPNVTAQSIPLHNSPLNTIMRKYNMQADAPDRNAVYDNDEDYHAKTERVYLFANPAPDDWRLPPNARPLSYFKLSDRILQQHVLNAHLHVYVRQPDDGANSLANNARQGYTIKLYMVASVADPDNIRMDLISSKEVKVNAQHGRWHKLNVKKIIDNWTSRPHENFGIYASLIYADGSNLIVNPRSNMDDGSHNMYLDIVMADGGRSRHKRGASADLDCTGDREQRCCRHRLVIDFESFGWHFVLAPKKYMAYYCAGSCPYQHLQQYMHTQMIQNVNLPGAGPCCTPADMADMLMLYFNSNNELTLAKVPGMVVTRCGCA